MHGIFSHFHVTPVWSNVDVVINRGWIVKGIDGKLCSQVKRADLHYSVISNALEYQIVVNTKDAPYTFPAGVEGSPRDWDFYEDDSYRVKIVKK